MDEVVELPKTQKVLSFEVTTHNGIQFSVSTTAIPEPLAGEVLIKLSATSVCGTDLALASGKLGPCKSILGHEGLGRVVRLGASSHSGIRIGDRIGVTWVRDICGQCIFCLSPDGETRCVEQINSGRKVDGSFAQYAIVPQRYLVSLPEGLNDESIAPILCGGVTAYKALKICGATPGKWIAVTGAGGGVGGLAIQYAKAMGYQVLALDIGKEDFCRRMGAHVYIDVNAASETTSRVREVTNGKMASAVIAAAGSGAAYQQSLDLLAPFGTLVCVGIPPPDQKMQLHPLAFIDRGIRIIGSAVGSRKDLDEALDFVVRGVVSPAVEVIALEEAPPLLRNFAAAKAKYVIKLDE